MTLSKKLERVPAAPFARWLNQRLEYWRRQEQMNSLIPGLAGTDSSSIKRLLQEIGWPDADSGARRLYRYRRMISETAVGKNARLGIRGTAVTRTTETYPRQIVEDALHHAGVLFSEVYPEIAAAEDQHLEPEAWCPGCQDMTHPINGQCAWCDWQITKPTGQTLMGRVLKVAA